MPQADRDRVAAYVAQRSARAEHDRCGRSRAMPDGARRAIRGVLTDIDDTLSTHGRLTAEAYAAMERLRAAGKLVIPITGRPAGWCDHIARMWPVDAVVGENGALYMRYDAAARKLVRRFVDDEPTRRAPSRTARRPSRTRSSRRCRAARSRPISAIARPTSRSISARTCRRCPRGDRPDRRDDGSRGHDRQGELDPRQRLVRQLRQADDDEAAADRSLRDRPRCGARALRVRRRFAERRADVRVLSERGRRRQRARVRRSHRHAAGLRHARRGGRGLRGARELSCWRSV